jgi:hypothetical protein
MLDAVVAKLSAAPSGQGAAYTASFMWNTQLAPYTKMMRLLDNSRGTESAEGTQREPWLFSENVASLGRTLNRVQTASIVVHDTGGAVPQTVIYRLTR